MAETKAAYTHVGPGLPPLYGARAKALILGSFPSPKSREQGFFYGHPQNRFWPLMASRCPIGRTSRRKRLSS